MRFQEKENGGFSSTLTFLQTFRPSTLDPQNARYAATLKIACKAGVFWSAIHELFSSMNNVVLPSWTLILPESWDESKPDFTGEVDGFNDGDVGHDQCTSEFSLKSACSVGYVKDVFLHVSKQEADPPFSKNSSPESVFADKLQRVWVRG